MTIIFIIALLASLLAIYIFYSKIRPGMTVEVVPKRYSFALLIISSFIVRMIAAVCYPGHATDMSCFNSWSEMVFAGGFSSFYTSEAFTDYPPGYMYILYIIGFVRSIFAPSQSAVYLILKMPAIICDILCGYLIHSLCKKSGRAEYGNLFTAFFIFNPAVILNSSVWGQVDSVFTLLVLAMLLLLTEKKTIPAYFLFAAAIFVKPQALFYAPVLIFGIIENVFLEDFSKKKFIKNLTGGIFAILSVFLSALPFGIENVVAQYTQTIGSYSYASVNAYNLWSGLGLNWAELNPLISFAGIFFIILTVVLSGMIFFSKKNKNRYFFASALICFSVFMLSTKMHERYAFPAMALMLCACAISLSKKEFLLYIGISVLQLINTAHVLFAYNGDNYFTSEYQSIMLITSLISVLFLVYLWIYAFRTYYSMSQSAEQWVAESLHSITRLDIIPICVITLIYSAVALFNLGNRTAPQTYEIIDESTPITADFGKEYDISEIKLYLGPKELNAEQHLTFTLFDDSKSVVYSTCIKDGSVFAWSTISDISAMARYLEISSNNELYLFEVGLTTKQGNNVYIDSPLLIFDEQDEIPTSSSYRNSTYFDEIYHARTAYEFIHGLPVYEWTHPPLGKLFISVGIKIFGMTPFGWRIIGTLFGIFMVPVIYIFSKKMFGITWLSVCTTLLFSFDFMHFAQTRIATIDVYVTFFIILMYFFMYRYYTMSFTDTKLCKAFIPLVLCGASMGLGIACKWTGVYAGAGLAILFFIKLFRSYRENDEDFGSKAVKTILFCIAAFVLLPAGIYVLSYIPYMNSNSCGFAGIIQNQIDMFTYHGKTVVASEHAFSSPWYTWIINYRPIWYYSGENNGLSENISSFGNPFVWIGGFAAFIYCMYDAIKNKDKKALFLVIGYLAQLVPWIPVTRITFIYHYFPSTPFLVLMLAHTASRLYQKNKKAKPLLIAFTAVAIVAFIAFYPVISGYPTEAGYVKSFLRWLPSWQLMG